MKNGKFYSVTELMEPFAATAKIPVTKQVALKHHPHPPYKLAASPRYWWRDPEQMQDDCH